MHDNVEVSDYKPPPPRAERIHAHTLLWLHKNKVGELGAWHRHGPGVGIFRESLPHSFHIGEILRIDALPNVLTILPGWNTITRGRNPTSRAKRRCHNARASEAVQQLTIWKTAITKLEPRRNAKRNGLTEGVDVEIQDDSGY